MIRQIKKWPSSIGTVIAVGVSLLLLVSPVVKTASLVEGIAYAIPSLVHIQITPKVHAFSDQPRLRDENTLFAPIGRMSNGSVFGSGVVVSEDGYIFSAEHLFQDAGQIRVWTADKQQFDAKIVGRDHIQNIVLLKIEANGLPAARVGDSMRVQLGESIFSAGLLPENLGLTAVVSEGIISTLNHANASTFLPIQTSSQLEPAMGGGGLFNAKGEILGIGAYVYSNKSMSKALSFSVAINEAMAVLPALKQFGRVRRSSVGVTIAEVTDQVVSALNLPDTSGVLVQAVESGGPAEKAGVRPGDVIVQFGDKLIKRRGDFLRTIRAVEPGATVLVKSWRRGQIREQPLTTRELL